ncbi:MAG TPA: hypothetical protein VG324_18105 [Blastocatellia bacterium]|nr:hypothetical protein [Blastocatellia bacterium]
MKAKLTIIALSLVSCVAGMAQSAQQKSKLEQEGANAPASTPTVDQILDKYVQAIGGKAAFEKLKTRVMKGTWENLTTTRVSPIEIYAKAPNKRVEIFIAGDYDSSRGFNGAVGWSLNMTETGFRELSGHGLAAEKREAEFHREIKLREIYPRWTLAGKERVGDREAYVIEATPAEGDTEKMYFDVQTGLLIRRDGTIEAPKDGRIPVESLIKIPVESYFEDYREIDGVKLPFTVRHSLPGVRTIIKFKEIKHNTPIEDAKFNKPAA